MKRIRVLFLFFYGFLLAVGLVGCNGHSAGTSGGESGGTQERAGAYETQGPPGTHETREGGGAQANPEADETRLGAGRATGAAGAANAGLSSATDSLWKAYEQVYRDTSRTSGEKLAANRELLQRLEGAPDSLRAKLLVHRIRMHRRAGAMDSTLHYTGELLELGRQAADSALMADAHYRLGFYLRAAGQQDSSLGHYYRARELFAGLQDSAKAGIMSLNMANILNAQGNYREAEDMAVEGLKFIEDSERTRYISGLYNALAITTKELKNYEDALSWYDKALGLGTDSLDRLNIANNKAVVLLRQGKPGAARDLLQELSQSPLLDATGNERTRARILDNLGYAELKSGQRAEAEAHLQEALQLRQQIGYQVGEQVSALHLAEFYSENRPARAYEMALRALELSRELENPEDRRSSLGMLMETAPNPRPYALAFRALSDSLQEVRQRSKDGFAKIRYESEKNRRDFLEARQEANARALELARSENRNLILLGSLLILIISGYFVYRLLKLRHSREQLKTIYQTEKRISKKVHDNLANDIFNIMSRVESEESPAADRREELLQQLDRVYRKSREISRDSGDIPTGADFERVLRSLAGTYTSEKVRVITKGWEHIRWERLKPELQVHLYRTVQELLVNMKKHSGASLVLLEFSRRKKTLVLRYKDNGKGLPDSGEWKQGGLRNTENRIEAIKGTVTFDAVEKGGVGITFEIPV